METVTNEPNGQLTMDIRPQLVSFINTPEAERVAIVTNENIQNYTLLIEDSTATGTRIATVLRRYLRESAVQDPNNETIIGYPLEAVFRFRNEAQNARPRNKFRGLGKTTLEKFTSYCDYIEHITS